jgi:hypothetical protein
MLKRTTGRFLLTVLVITGLAGTIKNSSMTQEERKLAINELKESKTELIRSVKGLSKMQLEFVPENGQQSIREYIFQLTQSEKALWEFLQRSLKENSFSAGNGARVSDRDIMVIARQTQSFPPSERERPNWKSADDALTAFKSARVDHIRYTKSTTEGLRDHLVVLPFGQLDAYQLILYIAAQNKQFVEKISQVKADRNFPKN